MLYNSFKVIMMFCSIMGILFMWSKEEYTYIIFPTAILIGGIFSFFDPEDKEYLRRNGINPDDAWFPDYGYDMYGGYNSSNTYYNHNYNKTIKSHNKSNEDFYSDYSRYMPKTSDDFGFNSKRAYKTLLPKCKRNFKITIETKNDEQKQKQ